MSNPLFTFGGAGSTASTGGAQTFSETLTEGVSASDALSHTLMSSTATVVLTLADPAGGAGPIAFDDQLVGRYAESSTGGFFEITDSDASADTITVAAGGSFSTGDLIPIRRNSTGDELVTLAHPTNENTYGTYERVLDRRDLPPVQNLLSDVAAPFMDEDTDADGLADGWNLVTGSSGGTATVSIDTDAAHHRHGSASQKVVASDGEGIICDAITVDPTATNPLFHCEAFAKAESGTFQVQLVDASNNNRAYPRSTVDAAKNSRLNIFDTHPVAPGVNFDDLSTTNLKVRIVARGGSCTFWVDAAQLLQQHAPTGTFHKARAANKLWQVANDELSSKASPADRYDVGAFDFYRRDVDRWPDDKIEAGNTIRLTDNDESVDDNLRVVEVERDLLTPAASKYRVDRRPRTVAERIAERDIPEMFDERPPQSGSNRTEGSPANVLDLSVSANTSGAIMGKFIVPGLITNNPADQAYQPAVGTLLVAPWSPGSSFTIQSILARDQGGGAGTARVAIYSDNGGYPDTLLYESGDITLDGTANDFTVSGPIIEAEVGQVYWVGFQLTGNSSGNAGLITYNDSFMISVGRSGAISSGTEGGSIESTGNGSSVPGVFPATATIKQLIPAVGLEVPS